MTNMMISGRIVKDAITRQVMNAKGLAVNVTEFAVAVNDGYDPETKQPRYTNFWKVSLWQDKGANLKPYLTKGRKVDVKGIPTIGKPWVGEDGQLHNGSLELKEAQVELGDAFTKAEADFAGEVIPA